jgi:predicted pyridoxine 5'-phosphate oxidase superfamily flavin-nucleotide-binding protein
MISVFHPGELAAQAKAGLSAEAERLGGMVRTTVPPAAADFLTEQSMLVIGGGDEQGRVWASLLTGAPGFLRAGTRAAGDVADPAVVDIAAHPLPSDPLAAALTREARIGAIAIDPSTRRRMRINGLAGPTAGGLRLTAEQVYANCPKYIQRRDLESVRPDGPGRVATLHKTLDAAARQMIIEADTFFVATVSATGDYDASHRGGNPGFVGIDRAGTLAWPDYRGNAMMMTLGNLEQNPAAGLLFVEWSTGTTLQLTGAARVDWDHSERLIRFGIAAVHRTELASPLSWSEPEYSRFNPSGRAPFVGR